MSKFGIHMLALASDWRPAQADAIFERLAGCSVGLLELPLLRPADIDCAATRKAAERNGCELAFSLCLPDSLDVLERTDEAANFLKQALEVADRSGSKILTGVTYASLGKLTGQPPQEAELDAVCRLLDSAGRHARERGMRLGVEVVNRYENHLLNAAFQARRLLERIGAANLFVHLDTYHMNIEEAGMAAGFADAGELLGYVHLSESNRGVPGQGTVDWQDVFAGLRDAGFEGTAVLESFVCMDEDLASGVAIWRPVADNPEAVVDEGVPYLVKIAGEKQFSLV